ncbi:hypothetical protein TNCT_95641 [Trichonephila clavata]|uniref:Uncharacterized protein n=2 Tax=Trichonephila TaxID=2585208 RepID=A0A8X6LD56_TRICU|nr:hypothetical protein TNCT_95641 [Trichonephila clavata]GFY55385.1 hypothetical protein TNIN_441841 [Trichonephila inaurata madagascariensis]
MISLKTNFLGEIDGSEIFLLPIFVILPLVSLFTTELSWRKTSKILSDLVALHSAALPPNPTGIIALSLQSKQMDHKPISGGLLRIPPSPSRSSSSSSDENASPSSTAFLSTHDIVNFEYVNSV